jgi:hypothetical protein
LSEHLAKTDSTTFAARVFMRQSVLACPIFICLKQYGMPCQLDKKIWEILFIELVLSHKNLYETWHKTFLSLSINKRLKILINGDCFESYVGTRVLASHVYIHCTQLNSVIIARTVLSEKLIFGKRVQKFWPFYGTQKLMFAFRTIYYCSLFWAR